jgi:hypothetical protein
MLAALVMVVIGLVSVLSGVWERNYLTITIGAMLMLGGWFSFYVNWRKHAKAGQINNDKD